VIPIRVKAPSQISDDLWSFQSRLGEKVQDLNVHLLSSKDHAMLLAVKLV